jgi:PIN domain nuclease of toxin-antitoxin system
VLDASAVLAVIQDEAGSERVEPHLRTAAINAVNLAEVVTKLQEHGFTDAEIGEMLQLLDLDVHPFDAPMAIAAGLLRSATRRAGLSLGDRACLAFAIGTRATVLTTDRAWATLDIGVAIECVR